MRNPFVIVLTAIATAIVVLIVRARQLIGWADAVVGDHKTEQL